MKRIFFLLTILLFLVITAFSCSTGIVVGDSMTPNFNNGDYLLLCSITPIGRFDVVALNWETNEENKRLIKRVIGLPGEILEMHDGMIFINDELLEESYTYKHAQYFRLLIHIPQNHFFVLGDNRPDSLDSRIIGPIHESEIVGEVVFSW